ncbi:long-chain-fatty-acid--CoA ligase [Kushneria pakistanensis]|uniref:Long-chain-fatty-acid--CoA ligase n=1 Tax=Kushneria pakistanensis TaxID=1508770 RepID=A0ABQ3FNA6_9GAMM|nr:AMP-binding protein [Kushneria pakistanensis]GHC31243.1 long-chain-fatty-acid--CoA ligase [Kushneria pakistanensis]
MSEMKTAPALLEGPALEKDDGYRSILDVFEKACAQYADRPAFTCMGSTLTYKGMKDLVDRFAHWIITQTRMSPGDRLAIVLPNLLQYPVAVFGALKAGLVVVNTNPLYTADEMHHQFADAGVTGVVIFAHMADKLEAVLKRMTIEHVIVTEVADLHSWPSRLKYNLGARYIARQVPRYHLPNAVSMRQVLKGKGQVDDQRWGRDDDLAILQYTGGTTGTPKGAMLSHANLVANMRQTGEVLGSAVTRGQETIIAPLPVYHIYTFTVNCMFGCETGNHSILIPNPKDLDGFVKTLAQQPFSAFIGLNTLFAALCRREDFKKLDFSHLKLSVSGGMALNTTTANRWYEITGSAVLEGYGMTETSPVVCVNPPDKIQPGAIGRPVAGTRLQVLDENDQPLGYDTPGELCVQGPQVMKGYWNLPEETAKTLFDDGWVRSGDIAVLQRDGFVRIVDRKKDMIVSSGFNVYPNEVEDVLLGHEDVHEAAVIGVPDEDSGESVVAFIVPRNGASLDSEALKKWCRRELTGYKVPRRFEFRDQLPRSNVGKVLRRALRDELSGDSSQNAS